jgi:uroporphyrinogen-III synthase
MPTPSFHGLRVLSLESRRATEIGTLISNLGGRPVVAPSLKEVPLASNTEALAFADRLLAGEFDLIFFLTGVGVRVLVAAVQAAFPSERFAQFLAALAQTRIAARGPKPIAALRERGIAAWVVAPEPNTWRELIDEVEATGGPDVLGGARVAVQEYGVSNTDLLDALAAKGAHVTRVPVYQWALPDDLAPLSAAIDSIVRGEIDVMIVTSGIQRVHLQDVADGSGRGPALREGLGRCVIASIGPSASTELVRYGSIPDLEASHPKMGVLVRETAEQAANLLALKRGA